MEQNKRERRYQRHQRIKAKIKGTAKVPRLCIFRSNKHIYGQLIDDEKGKTILLVSDRNVNKKSATAKTQKEQNHKNLAVTGKVSVAYQVGKLLAEHAIKQGIEKVIFDRGGYKYHGRVKALAEGARQGRLKF